MCCLAFNTVCVCFYFLIDTYFVSSSGLARKTSKLFADMPLFGLAHFSAVILSHAIVAAANRSQQLLFPSFHSNAAACDVTACARSRDTSCDTSVYR